MFGVSIDKLAGQPQGRIHRLAIYRARLEGVRNAQQVGLAGPPFARQRQRKLTCGRPEKRLGERDSVAFHLTPNVQLGELRFEHRGAAAAVLHTEGGVARSERNGRGTSP